MRAAESGSAKTCAWSERASSLACARSCSKSDFGCMREANSTIRATSCSSNCKSCGPPSMRRHDAALMTPELRHCGVTHIHDLIAMALGATRDGAAIATGRGVRVARLRAIKADILENISNPRLTVTAVALRQHVTPRYIHMLFETEAITFSEFVLGQRLMRTHRMLFDPRFAGLNVSAIAFAAGFGDLSYFNRTFRRRFGATPSELRHSLPGADHRLAPEASSVRV